MSFQHVYLSDPAIDYLIKQGIDGSLSGDRFSSIYGDLITEVFNGETKRQAGSHRSGFSTNVNAVNTWIKTNHIHAKLRKTFNDTIRLTDSHHKEATQSEMKRQPASKKFERPVKKVQYRSFWRWSSERVDYRKNH